MRRDRYAKVRLQVRAIQSLMRRPTDAQLQVLPSPSGLNAHYPLDALVALLRRLAASHALR